MFFEKTFLNFFYTKNFTSNVSLKEMLTKYTVLLNKLPKDLIPLMKPHKEIVEIAIKPGLTSVTWSSTNIKEC